MADTKITALSALTGSTVSAADVIPLVSVSATATSKLTVQGLFDSVQTIPTAATVSSADTIGVFSVSSAAVKGATISAVGTAFSLAKAGSFTRDQTAASGNQAVTGIGFKPKAVIFLAGESGTSKVSAGVDDGSNSGLIFQNIPAGADAFNATTGNSILLTNAAGVQYAGAITSLDADGFTVAWTKTGSPTGTATIVYLALK